MQTKYKPHRLSTWFKFHQFWLIFLTSIVFLSCSEEDYSAEAAGEIPSYSVDNLKSTLPELTVKSKGVFDPQGFISPYYIEPLQEGRYIAVNDRLEQMIHLFDEMGTQLVSVGGEGRGPGEFMGAMNLHAGRDNDLYVLDVPHHKITRFKLRDEELIYDTTYSVNHEPGSLLRKIYVTPWGNFGVIRSIVEYSSGEEVYYLYKLDASFNQAERLFEMPGNEKMSLSEWSHIDHIVGQKTFWDLDGEWFYYITSHSATINRYNLRTGEISVDTFFDLAEREITPENREHLMELASNIVTRFPSLRKTIESVTVLPIFSELVVYDNILYLTIFNLAKDERTEIIRINKETGNIHYIDVSLKLWRIQAGNGFLYGIENRENGDETVQILNLEDTPN